MATKVLKDFDILYTAMDGFIRSNNNFESSMVINMALDELEQCTSIQQCFSVPLQHKLFSMDSSLKWVLFLVTIPEKIIEQNSEDEEFMQIMNEFKVFSEFSCVESMKLIASIYDIGMQDNIFLHLDDEDSDNEEDNSEDDEDSDSDDSNSDEESNTVTSTEKKSKRADV